LLSDSKAAMPEKEKESKLGNYVRTQFSNIFLAKI